MSSDSRADRIDQASRKQKMMGVLAVSVIVLSVVYFVWAAWPKPQPVIPPANDPATQWMASYGAVATEHAKKLDAFYHATSGIALVPTDDKSGIIVRGSVQNAAQLELLKAELSKVSPTVPLQWEVRIGQ